MGNQHDQCEHGRCKDHDPEMKKVKGRVGKRFDSHSIPFGPKYQNVNRHKECGYKIMEHRIYTKLSRCRICGREEEHVVGNVAYCPCCGYHHTSNMPVSDRRKEVARWIIGVVTIIGIVGVSVFMPDWLGVDNTNFQPLVTIGSIIVFLLLVALILDITKLENVFKINPAR
ncbi:hypothetical protein MYX06_01520 [Patescibacteria group bacterium AH-259-L05]|nr:hypothetical protein [Patescibacteria group bacterium AH-259-L05]